MMNMTLRTYARYPFLSDALNYVKTQGPSLEEIIADLAYERARARGKQRLIEAIEKGELAEPTLISEPDCIMELLSYVIARIIVSAVGEPWLIRRYALAEAKSVSKRLEADDVQFVTQVATEFGFDVKLEPELRVHFTDFIKYATAMHKSEWKLINQHIEAGYVTLSKVRLARLIEEALKIRIERELPAPVDENIERTFAATIRELRGMVASKKRIFTPQKFGKLVVSNLPPCIKQLVTSAQQGEHIPHLGRFTLASFLHAVGLSNDEILKLFSASPDFDEKKARYQVDHITGVISGTEYTPPECSTMKTYGLCINPDRMCEFDWLTHPLKYYRAKGRSRRLKK
jgi:DNA primase large subunit